MSAAKVAAVKQEANGCLFDLLIRHADNGTDNANLQYVANTLRTALSTWVSSASEDCVRKSEIVNAYKAEIMTVLRDQSLQSLHKDVRDLMAAYIPPKNQAEKELKDEAYLLELFNASGLVDDAYAADKDATN